ncbi:Magnesium-chelatase subunit H [Heracleum sosnowskyi]|uniref:Magnesium-chelatase subunit H n=1 Tax=Heracleum sosnowskyi TaxID=360622 RepID=A0AAD8JHV7_9APIA|nr:Magnesium-chelatase subunit H [Heracleum sosnowskyi]
MSRLSLIFFMLVFLLLNPCTHTCCSSTWCPQDYIKQRNKQFEQRSNKFWEFDGQSKTWVELKLPFDVVSCVNDDCTKVGSLEKMIKIKKKTETEIGESFKKMNSGKDSTVSLPLRKRVSLVKMSEASIWVTGVSGSIYERFWNGLQWVIAPHDLPLSAGFAIASFIVNQTILALSDAGNLYQMQLGENSQPVWVDFRPVIDYDRLKETEEDTATKLRYGVISHDRERIYFCTRSGLLLELCGIQPPSWINHGKPPGANVAAIADVGTVKPDIIFTVSSTGDLYEYDISSKPMWKKHIWIEGSTDDTSLMPSLGFTVHGIYGAQSTSLFLLTKGGKLIERRLHQRKWKWVVHGSPKHQFLTSITPVSQDELMEKSHSLFLTTETGFVFEYQIPKHPGPGAADNKQISENWVNHMHPPHAKAAKGVAGLEFQVGRLIFPLDDGRLGELHFPGIGGEESGPYLGYIRRKPTIKHIWSILDAPETEGWNADYCTESRGPSNCIIGLKDEADDTDATRSVIRRRKGNRAQHNYLSFVEARASLNLVTEDHNIQDQWVNTNFRLRVMFRGLSFFLISDGGLLFEYLSAENMWFWMRHEHSKAMKGVLGNYNGSLFLVDEQKNLLIRERSSTELQWINCTAMKRGRHVIGGPPWDVVPGKNLKVTAEDALFLVSKSGRLLQLTVALRKFKWKDCRYPQTTKIASIVDQEVLRGNIVFVVGRNSRLYQYNKVTELWHEHYQSQHLVLSRAPGTAMRPSSSLLTGSLFILSEDGKLIEYHWSSTDGWNWIEHGTPGISVVLVGSPGPSFLGNQLFLVGSDGRVYLRYLESDQSMWKWKDYSFPYITGQTIKKSGKEDPNINEDFSRSSQKIKEDLHGVNRNCDPKIAATRPIPFAEDSVIFELRDGRLGEMKLNEDGEWAWSRIIGTPTSLCIENYWTAMAS